MTGNREAASLYSATRGTPGPADEVGDADAWVDRLFADSTAQSATPGWRERLQAVAARPWRGVRGLASYATTTPGTMLIICVISTLAILAAGLSTAASSRDRRESLDQLLTATEPTNSAAHDLYTSLSLADVIAAGDVVKPGAPAEQRYEEAIDQASIAALDVASRLPADYAELLSTVYRAMPEYAAIVATARANLRHGYPVGVAYMAQASALMQESVLPAAGELFNATRERVSSEQAELTRPQWVPLSGLLAAIGALALGQWWLWRLTKRRLNRGFLAATALMLLATAWVGAADFAAWRAGSVDYHVAATPWETLTTSRIVAQRAHTDETLALVERRSLAPGETSATRAAPGTGAGTTAADESAVPRGEDFAATTEAVARALDDFDRAAAVLNVDSSASQVARVQLENWSQAHAELAAALSGGNFGYADEVSAISEVSTAATYTALDDTLAELISVTRDTMRSHLTESLRASRAVSLVVALLSFLAVVAVWLGIRPRLQEYL